MRTVFGLASQRKAVQTNPAQDHAIKAPKAQKLRPKGFTDDKASAIVTAALAAPETQVRRPAHQASPALASLDCRLHRSAG